MNVSNCSSPSLDNMKLSTSWNLHQCRGYWNFVTGYAFHEWLLEKLPFNNILVMILSGRLHRLKCWRISARKLLEYSFPVCMLKWRTLNKVCREKWPTDPARIKLFAISFQRFLILIRQLLMKKIWKRSMTLWVCLCLCGAIIVSLSALWKSCLPNGNDAVVIFLIGYTLLPRIFISKIVSITFFHYN